MFGRSLLLTLVLMVGSCTQQSGSDSDLFEPKVNTQLRPRQLSIPDSQGNPQPVGSSRDAQGVQSDFLEGLVLVRPKTDADLASFIARYEGTVIRDDTIPEPPAALGVTLTAEQRKPTEYLVRINLARVDASSFAANATAAGLTGAMEFSTQSAMLTLAGVAEAVAAGSDASPDYIDYPNQAFPAPLFATQERTTGGVVTDAFTTAQFGIAGSQSNVTKAWQFLSAHGIQRRVKVAILDRGFWLNPDGTARSATDSDFPPGVLTQYDFDQNDFFADGPNLVLACGEDNPCFWHGTGSAGVAMGLLNNKAGAAGTGGQIADPMLFKFGADRSQFNWAVRTAVAWGADVVSASVSTDCDEGCRAYDRKHTPFDDAVDAGSRTVFLTAAGNDGKDVDDEDGDNFVHPCTEDHVNCIGALANNATTRIGYSNYGGHVKIFAPTNIPVMSFPPSQDVNGKSLPASQAFGAETPQSFGGTSGATPFVAGVAAMMKAINPDLNSDQVGDILYQTGHVGEGEVIRYIDAYAAVRRVAESVPGVKDRFENNDLEKSPANLGALPAHSQPNLNLERVGDVDYFRVDVPSSSIMTVDIRYMQLLGSMDVVNFTALGSCGGPIYYSDEGLRGEGHRFEYRVSGGPVEFAVVGADINAYDLSVSYAPTESLAPDSYEVNDTIPAAKYIRSFRTSGAQTRARSEAIVTIDASIHNAIDVDYFKIRGAHLTAAEQILLVGYPAVKVYGNESPVNLDVWRLNADNTQGALVGSVIGGSCTNETIAVRLEEDQYYLVRVTGGIGRYTLRNGLDTKRRDIDVLVQDPIYIILHPADPIEHAVRFSEKYIFVADGAYSQVRSSSAGIHLALLDSANNLVAEGVTEQGLGERLSLTATIAGQVYALRATPQIFGAEPPMLQLEWDAVQPVRESLNLVRDPGAEDGNGDGLPNWDPPSQEIQDVATATSAAYSNEGGYPTPEGPGPADRGTWFFSGGPDNPLSGVRQTITIDPAWRQAIDDGRVKFDLFAFLGGLLDQADHTDVALTFLDANQQPLGEATLPSVTPLEREAQTGLFAVQSSDRLPRGTTQIRIELTFTRVEGAYNDGSADNLQLILSEYSQ